MIGQGSDYSIMRDEIEAAVNKYAQKTGTAVKSLEADFDVVWRAENGPKCLFYSFSIRTE